jgi:uracil-DNA glycosylase
MITLHPRLLLKNTELKKAAWQDLQMIQRLLREQ